MRLAIFAAALILAPATASAAPPEVEPLFLGEIDARLHSAERVEGENAFAVTRLRLGARAVFTSWFRAVAQAEWAQEKPALLDAYLSFDVARQWEISLGARKTPLFSSARDDAVWLLPIPERPMVTRAFWPSRDVGVEIHRRPTSDLPLEGFLRFDNGSGSVLGNDNSQFALDARLDAVFDRAMAGASPSRPFGLRVGSGLHLETAEDRLGIRATTPDGFLFYRPATVSGPRYVAEAHLALFAGPLRIIAAATHAREGRSRDTDGNPDTPRVEQASIPSSGAFIEAAWMIRGPWRTQNTWPMSTPIGRWDGGAFEVAARFERLDLGYGAPDVARGGATHGGAAIRWWATSFCALSLAGYFTAYDVAPVEEPDTTQSWLGLLRATVHVPTGKRFSLW